MHTSSDRRTALRRPARQRTPGPLATAAVALLVVLAGAALVLSARAPRLAGTEDVRFNGYPVQLDAGQQICQQGGAIPPDAEAVAFPVGTEGRRGPALRVSAAGRDARVAAGYRDGAIVRAELPASRPGARNVCIANEGARRVFLGGQSTAVEVPAGVTARKGGQPSTELVQLRYLRAGEESWWHVAGAALRRWGYATALGAATPWLAVALLLAGWAAAIALAVRGRAGALACGAVGFLCAAGWATTTPALHVPDEPQHLAYAQYLAETGKLPRPEPGAVFSPEESALFQAVRFNNVVNNPEGRPPWSADRSRALDEALASEPGRRSEGAFSNTTNNPPVYYVAEAAAYRLAGTGDLLTRLLAMRLLSAVLAGLTAAFAFLFLRELLPGRPWAWAAGALALAVQPLLGFSSGGVNNDAGLFAFSALLLWLVARGLRRGLDTRGAVAIGAALGVGMITKATLIGFVPGLLVAAAVIVHRTAPGARSAVVRRIALAGAVACLPAAVYVALNLLAMDRPLWSGGVASDGSGSATGRPTQLREFVSYLWQFYLPRLPFMNDHQVGLPVFNVWFKGFVGRYGWLDTSFPEWVYSVALGVFAAVAGLAVAGLWRMRRGLRRRIGDVLVALAFVAGLLLLIGWAGYRGRQDTGFVFEQARYLLPLGGLYAALVATAAIGAGRRLGPAAGAALVVLACGHALFSVLLVAGRFYG